MISHRADILQKIKYKKWSEGTKLGAISARLHIDPTTHEPFIIFMVNAEMNINIIGKILDYLVANGFNLEDRIIRDEWTLTGNNFSKLKEIFYVEDPAKEFFIKTIYSSFYQDVLIPTPHRSYQ